jgi:hypothetical protein
MYPKESTELTEVPLSVHTTSNMKNNIPVFFMEAIPLCDNIEVYIYINK